MTQLSEKRIPKVVFGLTHFWLGIAVAFFWTGRFNLRFLPMWAVAILVGGLMAKWSSDEFKESILQRLHYDKAKKLPLDDRRAFHHKSKGVVSSLGPVPFKRTTLPCTEKFDMALLVQHLPKELDQFQFERLFANVFPTGKSNDPFKLLTARAARTLCHEAAIAHPAGIDRHGGRSLLTHTILVTALILHRAPAYEFQPSRHTANDPTFKLDPLDSLLPVIGFIHDIGKLTKLVVDPTTKTTHILPDHTGESVRILADFEEYWSDGISFEDRLLLQDAISYSHSINGLPVKKSRLAKPYVTSDRLYALVDFLNSCDALASKIEMGTNYDFKLDCAESPIVEKPREQDIESIDLYDEFLRYINTRADINSISGIKSVGFRYKGQIDGANLNVVVFDEKRFAEDFSKFLDQPELKAKEDKRSVITGLLLTLLDDNEILVRDPKEVGLRPAKDCLYKVTFNNPNDDQGSTSIVLPSAFVISLEGVERLKRLNELTNCHSTPSFGNSIYGAKRFGPTAKPSILEDIALEALGQKPTGQGSGLVSITSIVKKKEKTPINIISEIRRAIKAREVVPTKLLNDPSNDVYIVGYNSFFESLGIKLEETDKPDGLLAEIGVKHIKCSKRNAGDFIVCLPGEKYPVPATNIG